MLNLKTTVTMSDATSGSYPVTPRVQVDFERQFQMPMITAFDTSTGGLPKMEYLYWIGWRSMVAAKRSTQTFDEWLDDVAAVDTDGDDPLPLDKG
jgi:hypothetical protein